MILEEALETIEALGCRVGVPFGQADHSKFYVVNCGQPDLEVLLRYGGVDALVEYEIARIQREALR